MVPDQVSFFLVGAMKAGTSSVNAYLAQHPGIFMCPIKDGRFFFFEGDKAPEYHDPFAKEFRENSIIGWDRYLALLSGADRSQVVGESTALYLYSDYACHRIKKYYPDAKIIIFLREPASRTYSHYHQAVKNGMEKLNFAEALEAEDWRIEHGWGPTYHYKRRSVYVPQLTNYLENFPPDNLRIYLQEDLRAAPKETMSDIFDFLGVDRNFEIDFQKRHNIGLTPRHPWLYHHIYRPDSILRAAIPLPVRKYISGVYRALLMSSPPPIDAVVRNSLTDYFTPDILSLQSMIGRDLSHWM